MAPTGHDINEKSLHLSNETPIARGVVHERVLDDLEHSRRGSRKGSVVNSIKASYGLAEGPASSDDGSLKEGFDNTHRYALCRYCHQLHFNLTDCA